MEGRKKIKTFVILCTFCLCLLFSQGHKVNAASTQISKKSISIYVGNTYKLKITGASGKIKWTTTDNKVAKVSSNGTVKGIKAGKATITAKIGTKKYSCKVTVKNPALSYKKLTIVKGKSVTLKLNGSKIVKAISSDSRIASVTSKGKIVAKKNGTCKLTITGSNKKRYTCVVKVETPSISKKNIRLLKGKTYTLKLKGNTQKVKWSSSNKKIATVTSNGKVKALGQGVVKITAKVNTASYTCIINIVNKTGTYTKGEWIYLLTKKMNIKLSGKSSAIDYYFSDTKSHPYGVTIETARAYGIIPDKTYIEDVPRFSPNSTATREFAVVTAVRALKYTTSNNTKPSCSDISTLEYPNEDGIALNLGLIKLKDGKFLPNSAITTAEKKVLFTGIGSIEASTKITEPKEKVTYKTGVVKVKNTGTSYQIKDNQNGTYTIILPKTEQSKTIKAGKVFVLPANSKYPTQRALSAISVKNRTDGKIEVLAKNPTDASQIATSVSYEGPAQVIPSQIAPLDKNVKLTYIPQGSIQGRSGEYLLTSPGGEELYQATIGGTTSMPGKLHFDFGDGVKISDKAKLKGSIDVEIPEVTAKVDVKFDWGNIKVNEALVAIREKVKVQGKVEYTAAQSEMAPGVSGSKEIGRIPFNLGGTPLSLDLVLSVFYDAKGAISIVYTLDAREGIQYKDNNFRFIGDFQNSVDLPNIEGSAKVGLQGAVNITAFEIWDIIGVEGRVGPAATASLKNHLTERLTCLDATLYGYMHIGLNSETILGEFIKKNLHYDLSKDIYNENNSPLKLKLHFENGKKVSKCTYGNGTLIGYVYDGKNNSSISGARVKLYKDDVLKENIYTNSEGKYTIKDLPQGTYKLIVSATNYSTFEVTQFVKKNQETYVESALMLLREEKKSAQVSGAIYDGVSGQRLNNVTLKIFKGWNNTSGTPVKSLNVNGGYNFSIAPGNYTMQAIVSNYVSSTVNIAAVSGQYTYKDITMVPKNTNIDAGNMRIVLTWGQYPYDLDAHMFGPMLDSNNLFHVYYAEKNYYYGDGVVNLDLDDRSSYGPETITVGKTKKSGIYSYYVHDYSNRSSTHSTGLSASGAKVAVYLNGKLAQTFFVPSKKEGTVWHVFDYNASKKQLIPKNVMSYSSNSTTLRSAVEPDFCEVELGILSRLPIKQEEEQSTISENVNDISKIHESDTKNNTSDNQYKENLDIEENASNVLVFEEILDSDVDIWDPEQ